MRLAGCALLAVLAGLALYETASAKGDAPAPKVVRVSYGESYEGRGLDANVRRADKVRFKTHYQGQVLAAPGRLFGSTTGVRAPRWKVRHTQGGKEVKGLIHDSLRDRGRARVRVIAVGSQKVVERVTFVKAECHQDPPLYPLSCLVYP